MRPTGANTKDLVEEDTTKKLADPKDKTIQLDVHPDPDPDPVRLFCPECKLYITQNLFQHLVYKHNYNEKSAKMEQSKETILHRCRSEHNEGKNHLPLPCDECNLWFCDLEEHIRAVQCALELDPYQLERLKVSKI